MARRGWKTVLVFVFAALAIATVLIVRTTPTYSSNARLFFSTNQSNSAQAYEGSLFSAQRVTSYADLAKSRAVAARVIEKLGLDMEPAELSDQITATVVPNTVILEISTIGTDPHQTQRLTEAVAEQVTTLVADLETPPGKNQAPIRATIVDAASLPAAPAPPRPLRTLGLVAGLGLLLGLGAAVFREMLGSSPKASAEGADDASGDASVSDDR